mgnify:CR=1 FL=1
MNGSDIRCLFFGAGTWDQILSNDIYDQMTYMDYVRLARGVGIRQTEGIELMIKENYEG